MVLAVVLLSRSQSPVTQQLDQMCPVQLPSYAWNEAYWIGPNSCPQQGSVTSASCCCIERQPCRGGVGYPSVSAPVSPHFCCCIRRLNPTSRLLMRGVGPDTLVWGTWLLQGSANSDSDSQLQWQHFSHRSREMTKLFVFCLFSTP